jgi:5,10-methylenetetrahydromethanopterin reductase
VTSECRLVEIEVNIGCHSVSEAVELATGIEASGANRLSVWDSPALVPDCWTTLAILSQHVSAVPIGVAVTNPVTRHPAITASAASTLSDLASSGFFLGVGTGDSGVSNIGEAATTLEDVGEYVACVRGLLSTGRSKWRTKEVRLGRVPEAGVPIYLAAHGRKSLELAASIADGIFLGLGYNAEVIEWVFSVIDDASSRAGRDPAEIDLWWNAGAISVSESSERALTDAGWLVAHMSHHLARFDMAAKLVPGEYHDGIRKLGQLYDLSRHGRQPIKAREHYIEAAMAFGVWDYLCDRFIIAGTEREVQRRITDLRCRGVHRFNVGLSVGGLQGVSSTLNIVDRVNGSPL